MSCRPTAHSGGGVEIEASTDRDVWVDPVSRMSTSPRVIEGALARPALGVGALRAAGYARNRGMTAAIKREIHEVDADQGVAAIETMEERVAAAGASLASRHGSSLLSV